MSLKIKSVNVILLALFSLSSYAETCENQYQSLKFYSVAIVKVGFTRLWCNYGNSKSSVTYELIGQYYPATGSWKQDKDNPYIQECSSESTYDCAFKKFELLL